MTTEEIDETIIARIVARVKERKHLGFRMALPLWQQLYELVAPDGLVIPHRVLVGLWWGLTMPKASQGSQPDSDAERGYKIGGAALKKLGVSRVATHASMQLQWDYDEACANSDWATADQLRPLLGRDIT